MNMPPTDMIDSPTDSATPAWDDDSLRSPHDNSAKAARVNRMFGEIAESYDLNNRVHSFGRDQTWRRKAVHLTKVRRDQDVVVDVACGTGDLSFQFASAHPAEVIGIDFVPKMIEIAKQKYSDYQKKGRIQVPIDFRVGDAMNLDLDDGCADIVSIAFGIRNVTNPAQAVAEFRRVLRPGGRLIILEFSLPRNPLMRLLYQFYFNQVMPRTATLLAGDRSGAYKYLPRSVDTFITPDQMVQMISDAGFCEVSVSAMTFGICMAYLASVPMGD